MQQRWDRLAETLHNSPIRLHNAQGPCAWIEVDTGAKYFLNTKYNIECTYGPEYGASSHFARVNQLIK